MKIRNIEQLHELTLDGLVLFTNLENAEVPLIVDIQGSVCALGITPEQTHILFAVKDGTTIYRYKIGMDLIQEIVYEADENILCLSCCYNYIALVSDGHIVELSRRNDNLEFRIPISGDISNLAFDHTQTLLATVSDTGITRIFQINSNDLSASETFCVSYANRRKQMLGWPGLTPKHLL